MIAITQLGVGGVNRMIDETLVPVIAGRAGQLTASGQRWRTMSSRREIPAGRRSRGPRTHPTWRRCPRSPDRRMSITRRCPSRAVATPQVEASLVSVANPNPLPSAAPAEIVRQLLPVVPRLRLDHGLEVRLHFVLLLAFLSRDFDTALLRRPGTWEQLPIPAKAVAWTASAHSYASPMSRLGILRVRFAPHFLVANGRFVRAEPSWLSGRHRPRPVVLPSR